MNNIKKLSLEVKNFLFPSVCSLCGRSFVNTNEILYGLCKNCISSLSPSEESKCNLCGKPLISEKELCLSCRNSTEKRASFNNPMETSQNSASEKSTDRMWVIYPYTGKYRLLLTEYKFNKKLALAEFFAEKILKVISENKVLNGVCIVPVPPRPGKIKKTGWDQVEALTRKLGKMAGGKLHINRCLKRRESKVQKRLSRNERMENLKGRIYLKGKVPETALIIDDVITTGSTMEICADVLKTGGVQKVYGLCLFYD